MRIATPHGPAEVEVRAPAGPPRGAVILGHGAGGSVSAADLQAVAEVALDLGWVVALVTQPYRVAGKKATPRPQVLDECWMAVVSVLTGPGGSLADLPLVFGGRSSGARVACRCAVPGGAIGVLALAFPLRPPARVGAMSSPPSRLPELDGAGVPVLVVQGMNDRFGVPRGSKALRREVVRIRGDHGLKADHDRLRAAVRTWLP